MNEGAAPTREALAREPLWSRALSAVARGIRALIAALWRGFSRRLYGAHIEFNYAAVAPWVPRGARVADVGAWTCQLGALLAERHGCDVVNVDVVDANVTALPLVRFDGRTLPMGDASFDLVTLLFVLHHSSDDLRLLEEARRVLREGGRVLVAEDRFDGRWRRAVTVGFHVWLLLFTGMGWSAFREREAWLRRFEAAGFELEAERELGPHLGRRLWPENVLFVLRARAPATPR